MHFLNLIYFLSIFEEKNNPHSWSISEIIEFEGRGYLSV